MVTKRDYINGSSNDAGSVRPICRISSSDFHLSILECRRKAEWIPHNVVSATTNELELLRLASPFERQRSMENWTVIQGRYCISEEENDKSQFTSRVRRFEEFLNNTPAIYLRRNQGRSRLLHIASAYNHWVTLTFAVLVGAIVYQKTS